MAEKGVLILFFLKELLFRLTFSSAENLLCISDGLDLHPLTLLNIGLDLRWAGAVTHLSKHLGCIAIVAQRF